MPLFRIDRAAGVRSLRAAARHSRQPSRGARACCRVPAHRACAAGEFRGTYGRLSLPYSALWPHKARLHIAADGRTVMYGTAIESSPCRYAAGGAHLFGLPPCIVRTLCSDRRCVNGTARKTFFKSLQTALSSVKIRYINLAYHIYGRFINGNL